MSDEAQQYSIDNQKLAIAEYASRHGFEIVKTYADPGKSGVIAKHRTALHDLLRDVVNGSAEYKAILVYDVSRWGRYPNNDEAAHYEFLCLKAGIPLHYCAEPFTNDGTASSSILKALKRSMAFEFSRELSEKVFRGKQRIVEMGFWVGGEAPYAYRRMMVSATGERKQIMQRGESKYLTTDRVILVPGPRREVDHVRLIFSMVLEGLGSADIARELNKRKMKQNGKPWNRLNVYNIITNAKYTGCNVWNRTSQHLRGNQVRNEPQRWVMEPHAFTPIVDQAIFDRAQAILPRQADREWSDQEIVRRMRRLLKLRGRLSETLILKAKGMPATHTLRDHFGNYRNLYKLVGFHLPDEDVYGNERAKDSIRLRREIMDQLRDMFPANVAVTHLPGRSRSILQIDEKFMVSVLLCRIEKRSNRDRWIVLPNSAEREFITLVGRLDRTHKRVVGFHLFSRLEIRKESRVVYENDQWLSKGTKLDDLSKFYEVVKRLPEAEGTNAHVYTAQSKELWRRDL